MSADPNEFPRAVPPPAITTREVAVLTLAAVTVAALGAATALAILRAFQ